MTGFNINILTITSDSSAHEFWYKKKGSLLATAPLPPFNFS